MISVDTDLLIQLAQTAQTASSQLENAACILNQITTHENWGCWERETINDSIRTVRSSMEELQYFSQNYTTKVALVAQQFVETESGISGLFEGIEALLGQVLSIPVPELDQSPDIIEEMSLGDDRNYPEVLNFSEIMSGIESV